MMYAMGWGGDGKRKLSRMLSRQKLITNDLANVASLVEHD